MKIHSDKIMPDDIARAARIAGVQLERVGHRGSRSRARAFDFYVTGSSPYRPNNTIDVDPDAYAATWDEWGILIGYLYDVDPNAHFGKHSYQSAADFHYKTGHRFGPASLTGGLPPEQRHRVHKWQRDWSRNDYESFCNGCGAVQRWQSAS